MLEDLFVVGWTKESHQRTIEVNKCMQPSYNTKIVEDHVASSYVEEKTNHIQEHIHHSESTTT